MQEVIVRAAQPRERDFRFYLFFKRAFDLIVSGTALLLLSWLFLVLALVVKCSDGGRVFYRHERVGLNGKPIRLAKFRSMRRGADAPGALTPEQRAAYLREYKLDDDPRVTRVGKFLRKTSLDELPNLFAVFRGELSLVGPRPLMEEEAEAKYGILRENGRVDAVKVRAENDHGGRMIGENCFGIVEELFNDTANMFADE